MEWSREAQDLISKVPFFIRARVKKRVEEEALRSGSDVVLTIHVRQAQKRFMDSMEKDIQGYRIEACFGLNECPNSVVESSSLVNKLETLLASKDILAFLKRNVSGSLKFHHEFRIAIASCPNACSRPQIVDIGIIGTSKPEISGSNCTLCGVCTTVCEEKALTLFSTSIRFDSEKCVGCGQCIKKCPSETLIEAYKGYRVLIGGKLGRHPRLGREIPFILKEEDVISLVDYSVTQYVNFVDKNHYLRFGDFLEKIGIDTFLSERLFLPSRKVVNHYTA